MKYDVFISHSSKDFEVAQNLCKYLENNGIKCWIAPRDVTAGMSYARAILNGIDESSLMVLLFSDNANKSRHIESEVDRAFVKEKIIIPFRISDIPMSDVLSYYLGTNHYIDGIPNPVTAFESLKCQIARNLPDKQKKVEIDDLLRKIAKLKGITITELKNAVENLRTSQIDSFEDLLNEFIDQEKEQGINRNCSLPNEVGEKGSYSILENAKGEIMVMMSSVREGKPENPRFIYDGGEVALLYRNEESSVALRGIDEVARKSLKKVSEVLIVEVLNDDVEREYFAPVRFVENVENLMVS